MEFQPDFFLSEFTKYLIDYNNQELNKAMSNTTTKPVIKITTYDKGNGWKESACFINGELRFRCTSKKKTTNLACIKQDLEEAGYEYPKTLAPVMSAKLPKKTKPAVKPLTPEIPDRRTEYAA
jgi:hypothetical protein